ncbi:hypothetical protein [Amniculibacterium sp. G2-70]|uniref:hypothetical protein n=1 Tax=Amniculibacterium sp. G2-70 TaxID=2767188 RepID=UPI001654B4EF|nr:hypothetical protein [Amniculibacterium sp. G2-70]
MLKINGYNYSKEEVLDALRGRGYLVLPYKTYTETHIHGSRFVNDYYNTHVAIKGDQLPSDEYIWTNVAIREFQKEFVKPKLV